MVMAVFAYIYHQSFVVPQSLSIEAIMDQVDGTSRKFTELNLWKWVDNNFIFHVDINESYIWGATSFIHEAWADHPGEALCWILNLGKLTFV